MTYGFAGSDIIKLKNYKASHLPRSCSATVCWQYVYLKLVQ